MKENKDVLVSRISMLNTYKTVIDDILDDSMRITWFSAERLFAICGNKRRYEDTVCKLRGIVLAALQDKEGIKDFCESENGK